jgi:pimeloyl-ACP methyl ester carboxylesterase
MSESFQVDGLHVLHVAPGAPAARKAAAPARPPLLLVHGSGHGAWCWELWLERLPALGWEAFALSLRNHPGSRTLDRETFLKRTSVEDYADDVAAVARQIGRPCAVVGHSMGGIVVQRFAARQLAAGGALAALVLLASVGPGQLGPIREAPMSTDVPFELAPEVAAKRYFHNTEPTVLKRALERLCPESPAVTNQYSLSPGVPIAPGEITCPLLAVTAEHDHTPVPKVRRIAEYYGGDWLHDEDDGHDVMLEAGWAALLERILAWLDGHAGRG